MDFKYKSRLGQTWREDALEIALARDFPGCKTLQEALQQARLKPTTLEPINAPLIKPQDEIEPSRPKVRLPYKESDETVDF